MEKFNLRRHQESLGNLTPNDSKMKNKIHNYILLTCKKKGAITLRHLSYSLYLLFILQYPFGKHNYELQIIVFKNRTSRLKQNYKIMHWVMVQYQESTLDTGFNKRADLSELIGNSKEFKCLLIN